VVTSCDAAGAAGARYLPADDAAVVARVEAAQEPLWVAVREAISSPA
jgi:hypothetical protein